MDLFTRLADCMIARVSPFPLFLLRFMLFILSFGFDFRKNLKLKGNKPVAFDVVNSPNTDLRYVTFNYESYNPSGEFPVAVEPQSGPDIAQMNILLKTWADQVPYVHFLRPLSSFLLDRVFLFRNVLFCFVYLSLVCVMVWSRFGWQRASQQIRLQYEDFSGQVKNSTFDTRLDIYAVGAWLTLSWSGSVANQDGSICQGCRIRAQDGGNIRVDITLSNIGTDIAYYVVCPSSFHFSLNVGCCRFICTY